MQQISHFSTHTNLCHNVGTQAQLTKIFSDRPASHKKYSHQLLTEKQKLQNVYNIAYSQAVTHPSTNATQCCLTSVIGRELVLST